MMRYVISILITAMLLSLDPGVMPVPKAGMPSKEDEKTPSTQAYPASHDRFFADGETTLMLFKPGNLKEQPSQSVPSRTVRLYALGFLPAILIRILAYKRKMAGMKSGNVLIRLLSMPLGSHAPPVFA
jgi:hypothetical protein